MRLLSNLDVFLFSVIVPVTVLALYGNFRKVSTEKQLNQKQPDDRTNESSIFSSSLEDNGFELNEKGGENSLENPSVPHPELTISTETNIIYNQDELASESVTTDIENIRTVGNYQFRIRKFQMQKMGLGEAECEDRSSLSSENSPILRIAVADGATESLFSDLWSEILVNRYVEKGTELLANSELEKIYQEFYLKANQQITQMPETRQWFMYEKLERGTHATLAAIEFSNSGLFEVTTIGDSCVFWRIEGEQNINMFPKLLPEEFGNFPSSICHLPKTWKNLEQKTLKQQISFEGHLQIVLCTDAFACWLATEINSNVPAWHELFQLSESKFNDLIKALREQKDIRNDDVTLVIIDALPLNV